MKQLLTHSDPNKVLVDDIRAVVILILKCSDLMNVIYNNILALEVLILTCSDPNKRLL